MAPMQQIKMQKNNKRRCSRPLSSSGAVVIEPGHGERGWNIVLISPAAGNCRGVLI